MSRLKLRYGILIVSGILLCAGLALFRLPGRAAVIPAATAEERQLYLFSQGHKCREETMQAVIVPDAADAVLSDYVSMQAEQGLPFADYAGQEAERYVCRLEQSELYAELLVCDGILIGAMCCDPAKHTMLRITGRPYP